MALLTIVGGGIIGSWAFRAGNAVGASINLAEQRRKDEERRKKEARDAYNARRREQRAKKRAEREAAANGGELMVLSEAAEIDAPPIPAQVTSMVPKVRPLPFAEPTSRQLLHGPGLHEIQEMLFTSVWHLVRYRDEVAHNRCDMAFALAGGHVEAIDQMLKLAGIDPVQAQAEGLTADQIDGPQSLAARLEALGHGRFQARAAEFLLPLTPTVRRQILGS